MACLPRRVPQRTPRFSSTTWPKATKMNDLSSTGPNFVVRRGNFPGDRDDYWSGLRDAHRFVRADRVDPLTRAAFDPPPRRDPSSMADGEVCPHHIHLRKDQGMQRMFRAVLMVGAVLLVSVFGFAVAASAHVTISPDGATQGGYTRVAFRVPNESDTLSTTKLQVNLPTDQPLASVLVLPVPGWTTRVTTTKLATPITTDDGDKVTEAISQITWTATSPATAIKPGQFQEFPLSIGPLPKANSMVFKALQTYSDGSNVRWIDLSQPGQAEPEHPAPVLKLTAGSAKTTAADSPAPSRGPTVAAAKSGSSDAGALTIGIIGLVLGLIGAVMGGLALAHTRRTAA
jgi:periplasmic copper chaperone A